LWLVCLAVLLWLRWPEWLADLDFAWTGIKLMKAMNIAINSERIFMPL